MQLGAVVAEELGRLLEELRRELVPLVSFHVAQAWLRGFSGSTEGRV